VNAGLIASVHARLLARAKERGEDFNLTLTRYAVERFLYRLSISVLREKFWLKGALLFDLWFQAPHRPTRDADLLGLGPQDAAALGEAVRTICNIQAGDGMVFHASSIGIEEIREDTRYGGLRVRLVGLLGRASSTVQLDVGYGDAVTPGPEEIDYPVLLADQPAPRLRAYPRATVAAEKFEAIVSIGMANTRMKDYFDLRSLAREGILDPATLAGAIAATFARRGTALPDAMPAGLSDEFAGDAVKRGQWKAFLLRNRLEASELSQAVTEVREFVAEPLHLARERGRD